MEDHFRFEEETLFPPLESASPMASGPTGVMRGEHLQMRRLLAELTEAARARDAGECLGLLETLHLVVQQHNAKEEAILYPMADRALGAVAADLAVRFPG
jgi:iron-sulfur cluster repair protein YtfE (RIC family)